MALLAILSGTLCCPRLCLAHTSIDALVLDELGTTVTIGRTNYLFAEGQPAIGSAQAGDLRLGLGFVYALEAAPRIIPATTLSFGGPRSKASDLEIITEKTPVILRADIPSAITYGIDGGRPNSYLTPFTLTEGAHVIDYGASSSGNVEPRKSLTVKVLAPLREEAAAPSQNAASEFSFRTLSVSPNPCVGGQAQKISLQVGVADSVIIEIRSGMGKVLLNANAGGPQMLDLGSGPQYTYSYTWDTSRVGSGIYFVIVTASKTGQAQIRKATKAAVIR